MIADVPFVKQANSRCCWFACYQMLYLYKGEDRNEVKKRLDKVNIPTDDALDISKWDNAASVLGMKGMRVSHLKTFDNMVAALRFHMYQPVVLANLGEF